MTSRYKGSTFAEVCMWMEDTEIEYKQPCPKKFPSLSHERYVKYARGATVGESLALGSKPEDLLWDFQRGHVKRVGGPIRKVFVDIKAEDKSELTQTDLLLGRWFHHVAADKLGMSCWDITLHAQRAMAQREAKEVLSSAVGRSLCDADILRVLRIWAFSENSLRKSVLPEGRAFVHSDILGMIATRDGRAIATQTTRDCPDVVRLLCRWLKERRPSDLTQDFTFTSLILNSGYAARLHRDGNNAGASMIRAFGKFKGGELNAWPSDDKSTLKLHELRPEGKIVLNVGEGLALLDGSKAHSVSEFEGERYSVVFFSIEQFLKVDPTHTATLRECGINLPTRASMNYFNGLLQKEQTMFWPESLYGDCVEPAFGTPQKKARGSGDAIMDDTVATPAPTKRPRKDDITCDHGRPKDKGTLEVRVADNASALSTASGAVAANAPTIPVDTLGTERSQDALSQSMRKLVAKGAKAAVTASLTELLQRLVMENERLRSEKAKLVRQLAARKARQSKLKRRREPETKVAAAKAFAKS